MIQNKKQMFALIGSFILVIMLGTVTYAFFNYTRTGTANTIRTGRIAFDTTQSSGEDGYINLSNVFPIDVTNGVPSNNANVGEVVINVTGDTEYGGGIEYLVSAVNVTNTYGSGASAKTLPISVDVTVESNSENSPATTLGTANTDYFETAANGGRGGSNSYYKVLSNGVIENDGPIVAGYIAPGSDGVDGNIVIKAYIDAAKVGISDTYYENAPVPSPTATPLAGPNDEYGTPASFGEGKVVFTTSEWNSFQQDGISFQVKVEANEGVWVEEVRSVNVMNTFPTIIMNEVANIKEVYFNKMGPTRMQTAYNDATIKADLTYNDEGKVLAWLETNEDDNTKYDLIIASDGDTYLTTGKSLFVEFVNVDKIEFQNINTSRVNNMYVMFMHTKVSTLDLSMFDTSNVTDMQAMFSLCPNLVSLDLSSFNTANVTTMSGMFTGSNNLTNLILDNWDVRQIGNNYPSFGGISTLQTISMKNWKVPSDMSHWLFRKWSASASSVKTIDVTGWDLSNVTNFEGLLAGGTNLENIIGLDTWNTSNITNMNSMFEGCSSIERLYVGNLWNTNNVITSTDMFKNCNSLVGQAPNQTYAFDNSDVIDSTYARIATDNQKGYLTDISLKPTT